MSLKLEDLSSLLDPSSLRQKRGYRKGTVTRVEAHLETLKTKSLLDIDLDDLLTKLEIVKKAISSYEALQHRLEEVEGPDESLTHSDGVETQCLSMASTKTNLEKKVKHVLLAIDIECLVDEVTDTMGSTPIASSTSQQRIKDIDQANSELNRRARSQLKEPELKNLWSNLSVLRSSLNHKADEATAPVTPVADTGSIPAPSLSVGVKCPVLNLSHLIVKMPSFNGDSLEGSQFSTLFSIVDDAKYLTDKQKVTLLIEAMSDSQAKHKAKDAAANGTYEETMAALVEIYGRPRVLFLLYVDVMFLQLQLTVYTSTGLLEAKSKLTKGYRGLQTCKACTAENMIGQHAFNMFTTDTRKAWTSFNSGSKEPPTLEKILAFFEKEIVDLNGDSRPPAIAPKVKVVASSAKTFPHHNKSAKVHVTRSNNSPPRSNICSYCRKDVHHIHQCQEFRSLDSEQCRQHVNQVRLCFNCLSLGHWSCECNSRGR